MLRNFLYVTITLIVFLLAINVLASYIVRQIEEDEDRKSKLFYRCLDEVGFENVSLCSEKYPTVAFPPIGCCGNKNKFIKIIDYVKENFRNR